MIVPERVLRTVSVSDALTRELRARVLDGEFRPGEALADTEVAAAFGVSRPTAKGAITALVFEGLLIREANRPATVVRLQQSDVDDMFLIRVPLEDQALRYLTRNNSAPIAAMAASVEDLRQVSLDAPHSDFVLPDLQFHSVFVDAVQSPRLSRIYASICGEIHLCMVQTRSALGRDRILREHEEILSAVVIGDTDRAVRSLGEHLRGAQKALHDGLGEAATGDPSTTTGKPSGYASSVATSP